MAVNLARLVVQLSADSSRMQAELDKNTRQLKKFEGAAKGVGTSIKRTFAGLGAGLSVAAFVAGTRNALEFADAIDKAAQVAGLTVTELQELQFAGEQLGVTNKQTEEGFRRLARRIGEFANSGAGPAAAALKGLNIEVRDSAGALRSTGDVFGDIVARMEGIENQAQRSALAAQLFGDDAGPKLELLLRRGVAGLQALRQEAQDVGAVLDDDVIKNAVQAKDDLDKLSRVLKVQLTTALVELAPLLSGAANAILDVARAARAAFGDIDSLGKAAAETKLAGLLKELDGLDAKIAEATRRENSNAAKDRLIEAILPVIPASRLEERKQEIEAQVRELYSRISEIDAADVQPRAINLDEFVFGGTATKKTSSEKSQAEIDAERLAAALDAVRPPADKLSQTLVDYNTLLEQGSISWDTYTEAVFAAQEKIDAFGETAPAAVKEVSSAARDLGLTFSSAFEEAVLAGNDLRDVLQGLAKDILGIALRNIVTNPLADFVTGALSGFFASGTDFAPGGLAVVGERGREVVNLPRGSTVTPANDIGGNVTISVDARGSTDPMATERAVTRAVTTAVATLRSMKVRGQLPEFA